MKRLRPFRPWQVLNRYLYTLEQSASDGTEVLYTVEVDTAGEEETVQLYKDGWLDSTHDLPASIPVADGRIEVAVSLYGVTRVHLVRDDGVERRLTPVRGTLEDRRRRLDRRHPTLSKAIGWVAIAILVVNLVLAVPFALETATEIPKIAERFGTFVSPIQLPVWVSTTLLVAGVLAAVERVLTLRRNKILDMETIWTAL
ncbi:hypothetical protein SAMN05421642_1022 [Rhodococcoides kyotonense]|uniref:Uncharacterized protein n=2 Tax=Rhodococcoides kyotonense TaxID=398843 RepID=A0A239DR27_9NOCA|nr:hypothetical protein SAMN05421642_1022 [Rhodococcus kyotonensis]